MHSESNAVNSVSILTQVLSIFLVAQSGTSWHVATAEISSAYKAFSVDKIMGRVGVYIGLDHANVTLDAMPIYYNGSMDVHFNERFTWNSPTQLKEEYRSALIKGLPFPILTIVEYMAVDAEGFCWGRTYREAGYYTSIFLWASFALWLVMNVLMVIVPRYGAYTMTLTGLTMLFADSIYFWMLPDRPLRIHIEEVMFTFELGWCFWLIIVAGSLCFLIGLSISVIDLLYPHKGQNSSIPGA
jgi:dual oxidase maturation factor 1